MSLPTPYYEDEAVTIYHGDCREILPYLPRVDAVVTDPPYGIGRDGQRASDGKHGGRKGYEHLGWDSCRPSRDTFSAVLRQADEAIIWGGNYFADILPRGGGWLVWDKGQRITQSDGELAYTTWMAGLRIYTLNRVALLRDGARHPTQKPMGLMLWCFEQFKAEPRSVLDPFMGSGTTLRAAKDLGRKAIGIEIEEKYCEIAAKRMAQEVLPLSALPSRESAE